MSFEISVALVSGSALGLTDLSRDHVPYSGTMTFMHRDRIRCGTRKANMQRQGTDSQSI